MERPAIHAAWEALLEARLTLEGYLRECEPNVEIFRALYDQVKLRTAEYYRLVKEQADQEQRDLLDLAS